NVVLSPLGDYLGPRKAMMLCILIWTIALMIGGVATSFALIIICRILLGIGEGFYYPLQSVFIKNWFPKQERGRANAAWIVGQSVAPAIAMPFFTWWIGTHGWRSNFFLCAALGLIPLWLLWRYVADKPEQHKSISEQELAYIKAGQETESAGSSESFMLRVKPVITNYSYWLLVLWYLCLQCLYWGMITWLPTYLKSARGFSWAEMGWLASLPFVLSIFAKAAAGVFVDKIGRSAPILMVLMFFAGVSIYFGTITEHKYMSAVLLSFAVAFCTMGTPVAWTLLQGMIPGKSISAASGVMNGVANGLSSLSPVFIGLFISITGTYTGGLLCLVFISAIAVVSALILTIKKY
ncbi:MFS transporter, partial [Salmonella enterica]